jgi:lactoylglutathione lyase
MFRTLTVAVVAAAIAFWAASGKSNEAKKVSEFTSTTVDLGIVVGDVEKSVRFYTEAVGFKEVKGFDVSGEYAKDVGLTPGKGLKVRVLVLADGDAATKLKLIEFPGDKPKKNENEYISSELGYRYLTIFISDTNAALKRLDKAGVKPIAKCPQPLPKGFPEGVFLTIIRDPDGNPVELVGPKK